MNHWFIKNLKILYIKNSLSYDRFLYHQDTNDSDQVLSNLAFNKKWERDHENAVKILKEYKFPEYVVINSLAIHRLYQCYDEHYKVCVDEVKKFKDTFEEYIILLFIKILVVSVSKDVTETSSCTYNYTVKYQYSRQMLRWSGYCTG